jgi:NADH-quinone oxidoreductase subunit M
MNGFVGEFLVLSGAFQAKAIYGILAASGVIWSAFYMLWLYQRTFYGEVKVPVNATLPDANLREQTVLWPLAVLALVMGVFPNLWLKPIDHGVTSILNMQKAAAQSIAVQQPHALQTAPSTVATTQTEFTVHTQQ